MEVAESRIISSSSKIIASREPSGLLAWWLDPRGQGSIPGWEPIFQYVFYFFLFIVLMLD